MAFLGAGPGHCLRRPSPPPPGICLRERGAMGTVPEQPHGGRGGDCESGLGGGYRRLEMRLGLGLG